MPYMRTAVRGALLALIVAAAVSLGTGISLRAPPASAHAPHPPLDFHIAVDVDGDTNDDCDTAGGSSTCQISVGTTFWLKFYLDDNAGIVYAAYDFGFQFTGVTGKGVFDYDEWPDCQHAAIAFPPSGSGSVGCLAPPPGFNGHPGTSTYEGLMARLQFTCDASGTIEMRHGLANTWIVEPDLTGHAEAASGTEPLTINCVPPTPTPTPLPVPVGGLSQDPRLGQGATGAGAVWTLAGIMTGAVVVLASAGWYARRRAKG